MSSTAEIVQITTVAEQIAAVVGAEHCTTDLKERTFYSTDLSFLPGEVAEVVVRPGNTDELAAAVGIAARAGMAVASMQCGLLPLTQTGMRFVGHLGYHAYEGPAIDLAERERLVRDLGEHNAMILDNHGLLTCGPSAGS